MSLYTLKLINIDLNFCRLIFVRRTKEVLLIYYGLSIFKIFIQKLFYVTLLLSFYSLFSSFCSFCCCSILRNGLKKVEPLLTYALHILKILFVCLIHPFTVLDNSLYISFAFPRFLRYSLWYSLYN